MTNNSPRIPDSLDMQRLSAMQLTARMKETADKLGVGFIGGFIAPNGEKFVMTNMDEDDSQSLLPDELKWLKRNHRSTLTRPLLDSMSQNMESSHTANRFSLVLSNSRSMHVTQVSVDLSVSLALD